MKQTFAVQGMTCAACALTIEQALQSLDGVNEAIVHPTHETVTIDYDPTLVSFQMIREAVERAGYSLVIEEAQFNIEGMTCAACSGRIEKVLNRMPTIDQATINLALETGTITYNPNELSKEEIAERIDQIGFHAEAKQHAPQKDHRLGAIEHRTKLFWWAALFTVPLFWTMVTHFEWTAHWYIPDVLLNPYVQWALATPVQFGIGWIFYRGAYYSLKNRSANMDVLVALGTSAAYFYSVYLVFTSPEEGLYFETSAMLITLILLGKVLEAKAKGRSSEAIEQLMQLQPKRARVRKGDEWVDVAIEEVAPGDQLLIRPGEPFPVDGTVLQGSSTVDESMLTGESMPVSKQIDDSVFAATHNTNGSLTIEATRVSGETVLASIIRTVEEAQQSKAPIQRLADRISSIFVPIVVGLAVLTFLVWFFIIDPYEFSRALRSTIAVLVIACPCALGLATPTSIMAGSGRAAEYGILFKTAEALETTQSVETIVFDKTGTITKGTPELVQWLTAPSIDRAELLSLVASAEVASEHPIGQAVVRYAKEHEILWQEATSVEALIGRGLEATIGDNRLLIGNKKLLDEQRITIDETIVPTYAATKGETVLYVSQNGTHVGTFTVSDQPKEEAKEVVDALKRRGLRIILLTGDHETTAQAIAQTVGIDHVIAGVLPEEKAWHITQLEKEHRVAMVGDGLNDAPALATATIGIAMSDGTSVAMEAADITVMNGDLHLIERAIEMSDRTVRNIHQNLFWALGYNSLGIPIAAAGLLAPWVAGAAMAFSSISVVLNALRLQRTTLTKK